MTGRATLVKVETEVSSLLGRHLSPIVFLERTTSAEPVFEELERGSLEADAMVLGVLVEEPVQVAQRIQSLSQDIPIFILSQPEHYIERCSGDVRCGHPVTSAHHPAHSSGEPVRMRGGGGQRPRDG